MRELGSTGLRGRQRGGAADRHAPDPGNAGEGRRPMNETGVTQLFHARQGTVTPEMETVAKREQLPPELVREEVARGRLIVPANVNHVAKSLEAMGIGTVAKVKVNANIGSSPGVSGIEGEVEKGHTAVQWGGDTVMDLPTGRDIDDTRQAIIDASTRPIGTVPIYQAVQKVSQIEDLSIDLLLEEIEHQAQQGVDYMTVHAGIRLEHLPHVAHRTTGIVSRGGGILAA